MLECLTHLGSLAYLAVWWYSDPHHPWFVPATATIKLVTVFLFHFRSRHSAFVFYALADAIICYDTLASLPFFALGHVAVRHHFVPSSLSLPLQMSAATFLFLCLVILGIETLSYLAYAIVTGCLVADAWQHGVHYPWALVASDLVIVAGGSVLVTWPLYYLYLSKLFLHLKVSKLDFRSDFSTQ